MDSQYCGYNSMSQKNLYCGNIYLRTSSLCLHEILGLHVLLCTPRQHKVQGKGHAWGLVSLLCISLFYHAIKLDLTISYHWFCRHIYYSVAPCFTSVSHRDSQVFTCRLFLRRQYLAIILKWILLLRDPQILVDFTILCRPQHCKFMLHNVS